MHEYADAAWCLVHGRQQHELPAFQDLLDDQARRTHALRHAVYERAGLASAGQVLDVGCGSGSVTADLATLGPAITAVDIDAAMAGRTRHRLGGAVPVLQADGRHLPFPDGSFDAAVVNLVLLWAHDPQALVKELTRVVRPGGRVVASMEPDYGAKVHHPENPLIDLVFKGEGIRRRGGDPHAGRKLRSHFVRAGLQPEVGIGNAEVLTPAEDLELWGKWRGYYHRTLRQAGFDEATIASWEQEYLDALSDGIQLSWFPFFWAIGRKPVPGDVDRP